MTQQTAAAVQNNFTAGLKTEFTGLNFPENAATDTDNCYYDVVGNVCRRGGIDYEDGNVFQDINRTGGAITTYKWDNAGGDGLNQIYVTQVKDFLYFYLSSSATNSTPLSKTYLGNITAIGLSSYLVPGSNKNPSTVECQFSSGNGYLFVYHPYCNPFYCVYSNGGISTSKIDLRIRDFSGVAEPGVPDNLRPSFLFDTHKYNLQNQGWVSASAWTAYGTTSGFNIPGSSTFNVNNSSLPITPGTKVKVSGISGGFLFEGTGIVLGYAGSIVTINMINGNNEGFPPGEYLIQPTGEGQLTTWQAATNNYPSNSDVWWSYKDNTGVFNPAVTYNNVTVNSGLSPRGHYIMNAFNQDKASVAGIPGLTKISTAIRPKTGCWFQGRVWYTGVDASQGPVGNTPSYSWSESIYFSQTVSNNTQFGNCFQVNDPTSEELFDLLPTDGGVIQIQGCGSIFKLFPIQNGLLVFAANGIWFITGSQGIGFTANDYTVTQISQIKALSSTSFVNVQGLPYFWNEEGIYCVTPAPNNGLTVESLSVSTIQSFYEDIPLSCKKYVRGDYNPIEYVIQWTYRDIEETSILDRYEFNRILNYNTYSKAFYPYTIEGSNKLHGVNYVTGPGGSNTPSPGFKYLTSAFSTVTNSYKFTFAEETEEYEDWSKTIPFPYESYFVTGYHLGGKGLRNSQPQYVFMFSKQDNPTAYKIQGIWDYANSGNSGRISNTQLVTNGLSRFSMVYRKHRIRGHGLALQIRVSSVPDMDFNIIGWTMSETVNGGI